MMVFNHVAQIVRKGASILRDIQNLIGLRQPAVDDPALSRGGWIRCSPEFPSPHPSIYDSNDTINLWVKAKSQHNSGT